jgi:hypothetical protein
MTDPHLFLAKNAQGHDALWWGTDVDDRHCQELDLSSLRRGNRDAEKAVWEAVMGSFMVEDCTDWEPSDRCEQETPFRAYTEPRCSHARGHEGPHLFQSLDPQRTALEVMPK